MYDGILRCSTKFLRSVINKVLITRKLCTSINRVNKQWKVLFFGSDGFSLESLKALHSCWQNKVVGHLEIVTAYKGKENTFIRYATDNSIKIHLWPPDTELKGFDIGIVVSFGHLIPAKVIQSFPLGMINVHASLLPKFRGAAPICHALINGETKTGCSIMKIEPKKFDIGAVIAQKSIEIFKNETYSELHPKLAKLGASLLIEVVNELPKILNNAVQQDEELVSYGPKITHETSFIQWENMTANDIYNLQRGLLTVEPLRTYFNDKIIKLFDIKIVSDEESNINKEVTNRSPGLVIYNKQNTKLYALCKDNTWITIGKIIIPGKKPFTAENFGTGFITTQVKKSCKFVHKKAKVEKAIDCHMLVA